MRVRQASCGWRDVRISTGFRLQRGRPHSRVTDWILPALVLHWQSSPGALLQGASRLRMWRWWFQGGRTAKATVALGKLPYAAVMPWLITLLRSCANHFCAPLNRVPTFPRILELEMHSAVLRFVFCGDGQVSRYFGAWTGLGDSPGNSLLLVWGVHGMDEVEHRQSDCRCGLRHSELGVPGMWWKNGRQG